MKMKLALLVLLVLGGVCVADVTPIKTNDMCSTHRVMSVNYDCIHDRDDVSPDEVNLFLHKRFDEKGTFNTPRRIVTNWFTCIKTNPIGSYCKTFKP